MTSEKGEYFLINNVSLTKKDYYSYILKRDKSSSLFCGGWGESSSRPVTLFVPISSTNKYSKGYLFESFEGGGIKEYDISNIVFVEGLNDMEESVVLKFNFKEKEEKKKLRHVDSTFKIHGYFKGANQKEIRIPVPIFWYHNKEWLEKTKR